MHLLILLAITTGMRKAELSNLRWSDINFEKGLASLKDTKMVAHALTLSQALHLMN